MAKSAYIYIVEMYFAIAAQLQLNENLTGYKNQISFIYIVFFNFQTILEKNKYTNLKHLKIKIVFTLRPIHC